MIVARRTIDGERIDFGPGDARAPRARGRSLTESEMRMWRDLLYFVMVKRAHVSPADATRVLNAGAASPDHLAKRCRQMEAEAPDVAALFGG